MKKNNSFLRGLSIRFRMQGAVMMVLGLLTVFGALTLLGLRHIKEINANALTEAAQLMQHVGSTQHALAIAARSELTVRAADDEEAASKAKQAWGEATAKAREALTALGAGRHEDIKATAGNALAALKSYETASQAGMGEAKPARDALAAAQGAVDSLGNMARVATQASKASFAAAADRLLLWLGGFLGVAALVVWPLTLLNSRSIVQPIAHAKEIAHAIAGGDLTAEIDTRGNDEAAELLRALNEMQDKLQRMVGEVRQVSDSLGTAAVEIANGNHDLSARTEQTASNLQSTASSMGQLTDTVRQSADSARTANQLASSAAEVAQRGGSVVSQVVSTMEDINNSSKKIADIISVIDGIAFQTNILALNAAVEAARAGEQGRGFAVVASEVRSLAGRSADAAKEIKALIGASVDKVETGSKLVSDAGNTMNEIVASVQRVTDIIGEITAAASEQSEGIAGVNSSVNQLDQMTQQNAALVEQSTAAAESLKDQAAMLTRVVSTFRLQNDGRSSSGYSSSRTPAPSVAKSSYKAPPRPMKAMASPPPPAASQSKGSSSANASTDSIEEWGTF
jgi:methyl-accepting chemotaxis protein